MAATKPTTSSKTSAPKTTAAKPAAKPGAKAAPAKAKAAAAPQPAVEAASRPTLVVASATPAPAIPEKPAPEAKATEMLKLKALIEEVVKRTGGKKKAVKEAVEATLAVMGEAFSRGHDVNLPPLGRAKVGRHKDAAGGELIVVKLRRGGARPAGKKGDKEALAVAEE
jgi:nucleoid DNA-binding protein